jgi:hypothetical protein
MAPTIAAYAYAVRRHGVQLTWSRETTDDPRLVMTDWREVEANTDTVRTSEDYRDTHRRIFTPTSFRLLVMDLRQLGLLHVDIDSVVDVDRFESVVVRRNANGRRAPELQTGERVKLLRRIELELVEQAGIPADQELQSSLVAVRSELASLRNPWSWRATAPLRRWRYAKTIKDLVRNGADRLRR